MDDVDKLPSFDASEAPRRSTSSLGAMFKFVLFACCAVATPSWACYVPPPTIIRDPVSLIDDASAIVLVKAISDPTGRAGCILQPLRPLKGNIPSNLEFDCRQPRSGDWMTNFNWHNDPKFWPAVLGRLGVAADCSVIAPAFEIGHDYLLFIGIKPDLKEAEEVRAGDRWLAFMARQSG
jgi:hypothetical protein